MAKKILMAAFVLTLALAGSAFASGKGEPAQPPAGGGPAAGQPAPWGPTGEKLTLTGTLALANEFHPVLKSGGKEYELLVPRHLTWNLEVKDGEQVTVEGYIAQGMPRRGQVEDDEDIELFVTKATIGGKEYDLSQYRGPAGMMGRGPGGRMGGNGPWQGPGAMRGRGWNRGGPQGRRPAGPCWGSGTQS